MKSVLMYNLAIIALVAVAFMFTAIMYVIAQSFGPMIATIGTLFLIANLFYVVAYFLDLVER